VLILNGQANEGDTIVVGEGAEDGTALSVSASVG